MQRQERIEKLAKDTFNRAVRESIAGIFVLIVSAYFLQQSPIGSAKYYGCLLSIVAISFVLGVVWAFSISHCVVQKHPAADATFWRETFETQAKLLRFAPLWYVAPLAAGSLLFIAPTEESEYSSFLLKLAVVAVLSGGVIYINKLAAEGLEAEAAKLSAE